jgi:hypothetical protein
MRKSLNLALGRRNYTVVRVRVNARSDAVLAIHGAEGKRTDLQSMNQRVDILD